jgi:hypothetical protein
LRRRPRPKLGCGAEEEEEEEEEKTSKKCDDGTESYSTTGKGKVKSLCLTKHHAMKKYWGTGGKSPRILDVGIRLR